MDINETILSRQQLTGDDIVAIKCYADKCIANGDGFYLTMMKIYSLGKIHGKQIERKKKHDIRN